MGLTSVKGRTPYVTPIPEDTHPGRCIGLFDIGTVYNKVHNKYQKKLVMLFELPEFTNPEGFPLTVDIEVSQTLDKKSTLFAILRSWRGKSFGDGETDDFNLKEFALGTPCNVQVIHKEGSGDRAKSVYANVNNVFPIGRGQQVPPQSHASLYFDFDDGVAEIPEGTPERIARKIAACPEWDALQNGVKTVKPAASGGGPSARQAPAEIIDVLNEIGLAYPYNQDELDKAFPPDMSQDAYAILCKHVVPF